MTIFVRVGSHRAHDKLKSMLGYRPRNYFSWDRSGYWAEIPAARLAEAREITGITKAAKTDDLRPCIDWNGNQHYDEPPKEPPKPQYNGTCWACGNVTTSDRPENVCEKCGEDAMEWC